MNKANEPAFPFGIADDANFPGVHRRYEFGLTKREYLAARMLQGVLSRPVFYFGSKTEDFDLIRSKAAHDAVRAADALISELERKEAGE